ncbi:MAG: hypothetical protein ABI604_18715, partial [Nitrospirota bacterium]
MTYTNSHSIQTLKPSGRGELEITGVNNAHIADGTLTWDILEGWLTDAGTIESLIWPISSWRKPA